MGNPSADVNNPQYVVTLTNIEDGQSVGIITSSRTNIRRLPRGAGVERKSVTQLDWSGGRGIDRASDDATRYGDGMNVFSHISGKAVSGPLAVLTKIRPAVMNKWKPSVFVWSPSLANTDAPHTMVVRGTSTNFPVGGVARSFIPTESFTARRLVLLIRNYEPAGSQFVVSICADNAGAPGTTLWSWTGGTQVPYDDLACRGLILDPNLALTASTVYWVVVYMPGNSTWSVGLDYINPPNGTAKKRDAVGGIWSDSVIAPIFYLTDVDASFKRIRFFEYKRALYAMPEQTSGASGSLLLNGDRGVATGAQTTTTLQDSTKTWVTNEWAGCVLLITNGQNKGESRKIASNSGVILTLSEALPAACATGASGSEYVILGSDKWTAFVPGMSYACTSVAVMGGIVYFASGSGHPIRRMREYNNAGVWVREFADDGSNDADLLLAGAHWQTAERALYRARNSTSTVSVAKKPAAWGTNLTFEADIECGESEGLINGMCNYNMANGYYAYVGKDEGIFALREGKFSEIEIGMRWSRDERNGKAISGWMTNLYFSFLDGFERLYGQVVDDIGPNRDAGLPANRRGRVCDIRTVMNQLFAAYDAGTYDALDNSSGFWSSVRNKRYSQIYSTTSPGGDWHELFRAWEDGLPITDIGYQPIPGSTNRLWFRYGADIGYLIMPDTINPLSDPNTRYAPESHVVTGWFDLGSPEQDHYFDQLRLTLLNTTPDTNVAIVDYQVSPDPDSYPTPIWRRAATVGAGVVRYLISPIGNGRLTGSKIRFRITLVSDTVTPTVLSSYELRADTMNEVLYDYQFDFTLKDREMLLNGDDTALRAIDIYTILENWKEDATPLRMRVAIPGAGTVFDGILGHIDPVSLVTLEWNDEASEVSGNISFKQTGQYAGL